MGLVVGTIPLSLFVHDEDPLLPLIICLGNADADTGDDQGERPWYSLSYGGDHCPTTIGVVAPSCQLGFVLQLLEEDGSGIAAHLHLLHPLLVHFLDGGVSEHGFEFTDEVVPMQISVSGTGEIPIVGDPEVLSSMGPPVLGTFNEKGGGEDHHE